MRPRKRCIKTNEEKYTGKKRRWYFLYGVLTACFAMALLYFLTMSLPIGGEPSKADSIQAFRKTHEVESLIRNHYLGEMDEQKLTDYMYLGLVSGLEDKYSTYYTKEQYEALTMSQQGNYVGIGISIVANAEADALEITLVAEGSPAEEAGILAGDLILSINGESTSGMTSSKGAEIIQTSEDDVVDLEIRRGEDTFKVSVQKEVLEAYSVYWMLQDKDLGYIYISSFTGRTPEQFAEAMKDLTDQGMTKLIIDLRENPGGLVDSVCQTLDQILPEGVIVYTEDRDGSRKERYSSGKTPLMIPTVLLVNENSASASEIFAGAFQDYKVGTIVGTVTYGKGIVQDTYKLWDGSALRITTAHYYTPLGNDIHGAGITPDVIVEQDADKNEDLQLAKAVEILMG